MMRMLRDAVFNLLMISLLLSKGTFTDSLDSAISPTSILITTSEPNSGQTEETTLVTSMASETENLKVDITTEDDPTMHKASEVTTGQPSALKIETILSENPTVLLPKELPEQAVRNTPTEIAISETPVSETTSTLATPEQLTTESEKVIPGSIRDESHSAIAIATKNPESGDVPETTTGHLKVTLNLTEIIANPADITKNIEVPTKGVDSATKTADFIKDNTEVTTQLAEITTNSEVKTFDAETNTDIAESSTNIAEITTNFAEITTNSEVTTIVAETNTNMVVNNRNIAEMPTNIVETSTNMVETHTSLADITTSIKVTTEESNVEITTSIAETTTNLAEVTTSIAETTTNLAEITTTTTEVTTNLAEVTTSTAESTTNLAEVTTSIAETTKNLAEVTTDSAEVTFSRTLTNTPDASTSRSLVSKNHPETNEILPVVWFILILDGNCTHLARGRQGQRESGLKRQIIDNLTSWLDTAKEDVTIPAGVVCTPEGRVHANLTVFQAGGVANITSKLKSLEDTKGPLFRFHGQEFYVYQILTADGFLNKDPDIPIDLKHTDVELLIYITVGSTCSFLFLLAMVLLACKYCTCREQKPFDFGDTPNANMHLEDYTLTRIPRPKLGYVEYCRGLTKRYCPLDDRMASSPNGMVQPFDTSVVPLEDVRTQDFRDGVIVRPSNIRGLGGSLSRGYHTGCCGGYVTDADGYCIHSTENLHRAHKVDRYVDKGVDNPNFY